MKYIWLLVNGAFPKRDLSEASLALERGYHLTKLLARLSVYLADEASSQHSSGNFDNELRKDILRALDRAVTIEIDPLKALRRKIPYLEARTSKEVQKAKA